MSVNNLPKVQLIRFIGQGSMLLLFLFIVSRYFVFWLGWPTLGETIEHLFSATEKSADFQTSKGLAILGSYLVGIVVCAFYVLKSPTTTLMDEADRYSGWTAYFIRAAFWAIFLTGLVDVSISFMRVENLLEPVFGQRLTRIFDQARTRGTYVHYPIILLSFVIAAFSRSLGFIWLATLVVLAEFGIVISRFVFSYEQAFMGDLVRYWYAALFLFSSAYTLVEGGHVRVDVLYERFSERGKARANFWGSILLGLPVCWTILTLGMSSKQSSLIAPIIYFEVSQSGYGMYVKYLMAGFLIVFAVSMAMQFTAYFLNSAHQLLNADAHHDSEVSA